MDWVGKEGRPPHRSRSRSVESKRSSGSYRTHSKRNKHKRSSSRSSGGSSHEYSTSSRKHRKKRNSSSKKHLPTEVSLDKLSKVMANLVQQESSNPGKADMAPDFDPEDRTLTSEAWCRKMDDLKVIFNWSDESTIYFATSKLRGLANAWYNGLPNRQYIWTEFKDKLKSAFPSKRNYYEMLHQMMARRKLGNEKYVTYYYDKLSLLKACNISGEDAVSCIVAGIPDQVVRNGAEAADFNGLEALLGYMTAVENVPADRKYSQTKASTSKSNPGCYICGLDDHYSNKCPLQKSSSSNSTCCYNCGSDGHFAKDCRNVGRCFRCGSNDHFVVNCPQAQPGTHKSPAPCYMCGIEGHIAQYCPDAYKIRSKNCFICHKRGHLAVACPTAKYPPVRCNYCAKVGHSEEGCYNKMDDMRSSQQLVVGNSVNRVVDPYDVYEDELLSNRSDDEYDKVLRKVNAVVKIKTEGTSNGQDGFLSEGELGSEHSG